MEDLFAEEFDLEQMEAETEAMLALNYLDTVSYTHLEMDSSYIMQGNELLIREAALTGA